jgi:hypothetical protein
MGARVRVPRARRPGLSAMPPLPGLIRSRLWRLAATGEAPCKQRMRARAWNCGWAWGIRCAQAGARASGCGHSRITTSLPLGPGWTSGFGSRFNEDRFG